MRVYHCMESAPSRRVKLQGDTAIRSYTITKMSLEIKHPQRSSPERLETLHKNVRCSLLAWADGDHVLCIIHMH